MDLFTSEDQKKVIILMDIKEGRLMVSMMEQICNSNKKNTNAYKMAKLISDKLTVF